MKNLRPAFLACALPLLWAAAPPPARAQGDKDKLPGVAAPEKPADAAAPCAASAQQGAEPMAGCSEGLLILSAAYRKAAEEFHDWALTQSKLVEGLFEKEKKLKDAIQANSNEINELKFKKSRENRKRIKALERENKGLWKQLNRMGKEKHAACREVAEGAERMQRSIERKLRERLKETVAAVD